MKNKINLRSFITVLLTCVLGLTSIAGCKGNPDDISSSGAGTESSAVPGTNNSSDTLGQTLGAQDSGVALMFDGNEETYWSPGSTDETVVEYTLPSPATFNVLRFTEYKNALEDYIIEIKQGDGWLQIYRQDEMETRLGVMDQTYTADTFRITAKFTNTQGGIAEIVPELIGNTNHTMRNVSYFRCSQVTRMERNQSFDALHTLTDLIMFDFGCWTAEGEFKFGSMYEGGDEARLVELLNMLRSREDGKGIDYWFCLQNYDKETADRNKLLETETSRKRLANFALEMCRKYDFVGVDMDYEYPQNEYQWQNYSKFVILLKQTLASEGYKLSIALTNRCNLSEEAIKSIDYLNIMGYSCVDSKSRHSSYSRIEDLIQYYLDLGFTRDHLVLGVPLYLHLMSDQSGGQDYSWMLNRYRGSIKTYTNIINGCYFNGRDMIRDKTLMVIENQLSGVFSWSFESDTLFTDERSINRAIFETINRFAKLAR